MAYMHTRTNERSSPKWAAEVLEPDVLIPAGGRVSISGFQDALGTRVTTTALAAAGAVALAVTALTRELPAGSLLYFGAGVYARTTATAAVGAVALAVEALPVDVPSGSVAVWNRYGRTNIPSGTLVGRTYAERDARTPFGPAVYTDDEFYILAFDIMAEPEETVMDGVFVKPGRTFTVKENYLPEWATITANANLKTRLRAEYVCITGND